MPDEPLQIGERAEGSAQADGGVSFMRRGVAGSATASADDEYALVARAKTDDAAFAELYNRYLPKIFGYVMKRVGNREEAEDIVSHTFLKVVEKLPSFNQKTGSFKSWVYTIATNAMIDYFRKFGNRVHDSLEDHEDLSHAAGKAEGDVQMAAQQSQDRTHVFNALSKLPENYQQVITMKYYGDLAYQEIAAALDISENNVGVMLNRALTKFEKYYTRLSGS